MLDWAALGENCVIAVVSREEQDLAGDMDKMMRGVDCRYAGLEIAIMLNRDLRGQ